MITSSDHDILIRMDESLKRQEKRLIDVEDRVRGIETLATKYKGMLFGVLAVGGAVGWASSNLHSLKNFFFTHG